MPVCCTWLEVELAAGSMGPVLRCSVPAAAATTSFWLLIPGASAEGYTRVEQKSHLASCRIGAVLALLTGKS